MQSLQDVKTRLLAPSGRLIPIRDRIFAAPVHDEQIIAHLAEPWRKNTLDLDLSPIVDFEMSRLWRTRLHQANLRSDPKEWVEIDYQSIQSIEKLTYSNSLEWVMTAHSLVSGLALWFEGELWPGATISNHPSVTPCIYGQTVLPIDVLECKPGYRIGAKINAHLFNGEYIWRWDVTVTDERGAVMFSQSRNTNGFSLGSREVVCI